jgi:hypothetical protein
MESWSVGILEYWAAELTKWQSMIKFYYDMGYGH